MQYFSSTTLLLFLTFSAVTMKDDILTAVADYAPPQNVAPIAPLPSRLSFCLSPQRQHQLDAIIAAATSQADQQKLSSPKAASTVVENDESSNQESGVIISPTKKLLNCTTAEPSTTSGCAISMTVAVKRSPTVSDVTLI